MDCIVCGIAELDTTFTLLHFSLKLGLPWWLTCKNLPTMQETWVWSLGWEDSPGGGNGNPLQYSCLENSMDGGVW